MGQGDESAVDKALLSAIQEDPDYQAGTARVLVFTRNTANADRVRGPTGVWVLYSTADSFEKRFGAGSLRLWSSWSCILTLVAAGGAVRHVCVVPQVSDILSSQGVSNFVYHKNRPVKEQAAALEAMAHPAPDSNLVMVSTDAAARGIDLPQVTHVIQADFVDNAIEFLHRVGRTARAGRSGKVTSLYGAADAKLADAVRQYVEAGEPVADCFSRNRSFSRKVKRYGKFVPRGQQGPQT